MPRLWRARPSWLAGFRFSWRAKSQGRGRARYPSEVTVGSLTLVLAIACVPCAACARASLVPRDRDQATREDLRALDVDAWLAQRYPEARPSRSRAHEKDDDEDAERAPLPANRPSDPPPSVGHEDACARGDARACLARRDAEASRLGSEREASRLRSEREASRLRSEREAYIDPRSPVLRRGCFGSRMERAGELVHENTLNIEVLDGGFDGSR